MGNSRRKKQTAGSCANSLTVPIEQLNVLFSLAIAQLDSSVAEGSESVKTLTDSFTKMVSDLDHLLAQIQQTSENTSSIAATADELRASINMAIIAFQFYDRLTQRIDHTGHTLGLVQKLMMDQQQSSNSNTWIDLRHNIKQSYTMEAERLMFDHIMAGNSVASALSIYHQHANYQQRVMTADDGDIEFF